MTLTGLAPLEKPGPCIILRQIARPPLVQATLMPRTRKRITRPVFINNSYMQVVWFRGTIIIGASFARLSPGEAWNGPPTEDDYVDYSEKIPGFPRRSRLAPLSRLRDELPGDVQMCQYLKDGAETPGRSRRVVDRRRPLRGQPRADGRKQALADAQGLLDARQPPPDAGPSASALRPAPPGHPETTERTGEETREEGEGYGTAVGFAEAARTRFAFPLPLRLSSPSYFVFLRLSSSFLPFPLRKARA